MQKHANTHPVILAETVDLLHLKSVNRLCYVRRVDTIQQNPFSKSALVVRRQEETSCDALEIQEKYSSRFFKTSRWILEDLKAG